MAAHTPFALSLSKGRARALGFDKLSPNGVGDIPFGVSDSPFALSFSKCSSRSLGVRSC